MRMIERAEHEQPMEQLELRIWRGAANLAAAECDWLLAVAEFDRREGWAAWECVSCAAWLSWQVGLDLRTAHEKVRVARALAANPLIRAAMACGQLSYAKVRAISRIVAPDTEAMLVELAVAATASQVERIVTAYRRSEQSTAEAAARQHERRRLTHHLEADGSITIVVRLPAPDAMRVLAVVEDGLAAPIDDDGRRAPIDQRRADALVEAVCAGGSAGELVHIHVDATVLADAGLSSGAANRGAQPESHVQAEAPGRTAAAACAGTDRDDRCADTSDGDDNSRTGDDRGDGTGRHEHARGTGGLRGGGGTEGVGRCDIEPVGDTGSGPAPLTAEAVWRLLCDGPYLGVVHGADGGVTALTPRQRLVRGARRKQVELRDGGCRFPGCTRRGRIEVHHIIHRHHGGDSELPNLVCLCRFHHHRVHEGGWHLVETADDGIVAIAPNGRRLTMRPVQPSADPSAVDAYGRSAADGRSQWQGDRLDLGLVTELLHRQHDEPRHHPPAPHRPPRLPPHEVAARRLHVESNQPSTSTDPPPPSGSIGGWRAAGRRRAAGGGRRAAGGGRRPAAIVRVAPAASTHTVNSPGATHVSASPSTQTPRGVNGLDSRATPRGVTGGGSTGERWRQAWRRP